MENLIEVKNLNYSIPYAQKILIDINFTLSPGELLGVLGRNGMGKTTLMDLLLGFRPLTTGTIQVLGEDPMSLARKNLKEICFLSQDITLKGSITIAEYLKFYSSFFPNYSKKEELYLLDYFSLSSKMKIGALSTGQQKKIQAVGALSTCPKLILIDEITAVMDPETRNQFFTVINRHRMQNQVGVVLATNIAEDLLARASRVLFIDNGQGKIHSASEILNLFNVEKAS
jgi:ABC-2 type transport system ATP-binding protein